MSFADMKEIEDVAAAQPAVSLTAYVIGMCRKFSIFPSDRTTVLTHNEEMQILQYCSALHKEKACSKFDASAKLCEKIHSEIRNQRIAKFETEVQCKFFSANNKKNCGDDPRRDQNQCQPEKEYSLDKNASSAELPDKDVGENKTEGFSQCKEKDTSSKPGEKSTEFDVAFASVKSLFLESLKSSNHFTVLDVYGKFLGQVIDNESKLYTFVKSDFQMKSDMQPGDSSLLRKVETLTLKVLRHIAGIQTNYKEIMPSSPNQNSSQGTETVQPNNDTDESEDVASQLSSPSTSRISSCDTPHRPRAAKTPVQVFKSRLGLLSPLPATPITPSTDSERAQIHKKFIENIFRCYLHLLVNTRCELALAFVFNIPERELNHEAFTHLKHAAAATGLSMYQTLSSMLMRVRLGGNGYAPPSDSPVLSYIKGLGCLLDLVDKLQTVVEEAPSTRSGCKRVVNILKRNISTCKSRRFPSSVVESVANALWDVLDDVLSGMEKEAKEDNPGDSESQGCVVIGQDSINAFQTYLDQTSTDTSCVDRYLLGDVRFSQDTPTRFPSLMSQFRSPLAIVDEGEEETEKEGTRRKLDTHNLPVSKVSEALYLDNDEAYDKLVCTPRDLDNVYVIPSKTIVHAKCGADYAEVTNDGLFSPDNKKTTTDVKGQKKRGPAKRKKKADVAETESGKGQGNVDADENSPRPKSTKNCDGKRNGVASAVNEGTTKSKGCDGNKKQNKSCRRKLLPQIRGQSNLTGFFKV